MEIYINKQGYEVIPEPQPHIVIPTKKKLHGWGPGKRECTAERMLINPYNGCGVGCFFCYALSYPGYFQIFRQQGVIIVAKDFDRQIAEQLDSLDIAFCGYLSPITDPFQLLNKKYKISEKIIKEFVKRNIPIQFSTKSKISDEALELIKGHPHCFGQVSILTIDEHLRKILVPKGAVTDVLFENLQKLARQGTFAVCRIDPIFPYITDGKDDLAEIVERAKSSGAQHIIASILDIPSKIKDDILEKLKEKFGNGIKNDYQRLYTENIDSWLNAKIDYRKRIFDRLRNICERKNLTFALCMEYKLKNGQPIGLNQEFASSVNCEGINIPIYRRRGSKFYPAVDCKGDCLHCRDAKCGIQDLAMGKEGAKKNWRFKDYRRWGKSLTTKTRKHETFWG